MKRPCIEPGCPELTKATRCPAHAYQYQRQRDLRRGTPSQRGYDATYQRNRLIVLRASGFTCAYCGSPANTVDHVLSLADGGGSELENLVACCSTCNSSRGGRRNRGS